MKDNFNYIPEMTDPLSKYWKQPDRSEILIDDHYAIMSIESFNQLADYTGSVPTGTYSGKMWKSKNNNTWILRWIIIFQDDKGLILSRHILITN